MALATVTGYLDTVNDGIDQLSGLRLFFVPSGNAVGKNTLFVDAPAQANVNPATGSFNVQLQEQSGLIGVPGGDFWYYPRIEWLDPAGNFKQLNFVQWKVRVPDGGGILSDFIDAPPPAGSFVLGFGPPPDELEDVLYIDLITGLMYAPQGSI